MSTTLQRRRIGAVVSVRRIVLLLICVGLAGGGWWWFDHSRTASREARNRRNDPIPVSDVAAVTHDVPIYLDGLGTVQASATVTVKPMIDGKLMEVRFTEGQDVHVGDVLAMIDPRTYQAALDQAVAKKRQDDSLLTNARLDLGRYQKLAATAYTSAQQADTQKALVAQDEAQVAQDQAQIDNARTNLSYTVITAPVDGRTGIRQVDAGNIVHAADVAGLVVLTTLKPINVVFTLPQQALPEVAAAQAQGRPQVLALPQSGLPGANGNDPSHILDTGALTVLDNEVDPSTGTIKLKALFPNPKLQLWPGAFVTVRLLVETLHDAVTVPPVAVQRGPLGPYVYVVNADGTVTRRQVKEGHEDLVAAVITDGLKPGEHVVTDGASRLTDKARIAVIPPPGEAAAVPAPTPARAERGTDPNRAQRRRAP